MNEIINYVPGYEFRQKYVKRNADDTGCTEEFFVNVVVSAILHCRFDPVTKIFWGYAEFPDGHWERKPIPTRKLENLAFAAGFLGRIPLEV